MKLNRMSLLVLAATAVPSLSRAATYSQIGTGTGFYASSVNNAGQVAGYAIGGQYGYWDAPTGLTLIGGLQDGGQTNISNDGNLISGDVTSPTTGLHDAALYNRSTGQWTDLGQLTGNSGPSASSSWGMTQSGSTVVGLGWIDAGTAHATVFKPGQSPVDLGSTVAGSSSRANAVSNDGSTIVGWQDDPTGFRQGAYWVNGVQHLFATDDGQVLEADVVTPDGRYIMGLGGSATQKSQWRFDTTTQQFTILGTLNAFNSSRGSTGVSDDGSVVVGYDRGNGPATLGKGTIWIDGQGLMNLTTYVTSLGVNLNGRTLALPLGVSPDGTQIVGYDNTGHAFYVSLVPEPTSLALLGGGSIALLNRRRRNRST